MEIEKDLPFRPDLRPTRRSSLILVQKRYPSYDFGSVHRPSPEGVTPDVLDTVLHRGVLCLFLQHSAGPVTITCCGANKTNPRIVILDADGKNQRELKLAEQAGMAIFPTADAGLDWR